MEEKLACEICQKVLSSKQRLETHLQSIHGRHRNETNKKKYMLYKIDPRVPVPDRTKYRLKSKLKQQQACASNLEQISTQSDDVNTTICVLDPKFVPGDGSCSNESDLNRMEEEIKEGEELALNIPDDLEMDESEEHHFSQISTPNLYNAKACSSYGSLNKIANSVEDMYRSVEHQSESSYFKHDMYENNINSDYSSVSEGESSDSDSSGFESSDFSSDEERVQDDTKNTLPKPMSVHDEKCLALLAYIMKHHLSGKASNDLLKLLKLFNIDDQTLNDLTLNKLKEMVGGCEAELIDFCEKCFAIFPKNGNIYKCVTKDCIGLRYKGKERNQELKQRKSYFACLPVNHQIKSILEREGMWQAICKYRKECKDCDYISDILNAGMYKTLQKNGQLLESEQNISLIFNTDGIPLYQSSGVSLWPVYLAINELPPAIRFSRKNMVLWGVWQARGKPVFHTFLQPFIQHMVQMKEEGIFWMYGGQQMCTKAILLAGTLDLQAKAYLTDMTMFNGQHGCITCEDAGEMVKQGKGHTRVYPYKDAQDVVLRTTEGILHDGLHALEAGKTTKGIKGISPLFGMEWFDIVFGIVPDYMHGLLLGVTKKMLGLLFSSSNAKQPYFIGKYIKLADKILKKMKPTDQIKRLPRKVEKNLHHYKASELQMWLLFYAVPCLINFMSNDYMQHFSLLVEGSYILLQDKITTENLVRAEFVFTEFYRNFSDFYGKNNCTLNLHNVCLHLCQYVRKLGPLWAWSCFPFEDMNGSVIESVHGTGDVCLQILWLIQAQKRLFVDSTQISSPGVKSYVEDLMMTGRRTVTIKHEAENCKIAGGMTDLSEDDVPKEKISEALGITGNLGKISKVLRVVCGETTYYSEEYTRMKKRIAFNTLVDSIEIPIVAIQYFIYHRKTNKCVAVVKALEVEEDQPLVHNNVRHLIRVKKSDKIEVILVEKIREKVLFLNGNKKITCVARLPNLYGLCS